ncbi:MAG: hypothetical protein ACOYEV_08915 [Candidatus Nanopelagicales bacterium]
MSEEDIEARKRKAERGRLVDTKPPPPREAIPGEENKWYLMMGAQHELDDLGMRSREGTTSDDRSS